MKRSKHTTIRCGERTVGRRSGEMRESVHQFRAALKSLYQFQASRSHADKDLPISLELILLGLGYERKLVEMLRNQQSR